LTAFGAGISARPVLYGESFGIWSVDEHFQNALGAPSSLSAPPRTVPRGVSGQPRLAAPPPPMAGSVAR
jgi:hypothetical protein